MTQRYLLIDDSFSSSIYHQHSHSAALRSQLLLQHNLKSFKDASRCLCGDQIKRVVKKNLRLSL